MSGIAIRQHERADGGRARPLLVREAAAYPMVGGRAVRRFALFGGVEAGIAGTTSAPLCGDDLPLVMNEIVSMMGARGAILTLHPQDGGTPSLVFANPPADFGGDRAAGLLDAGLQDFVTSDGGRFTWVRAEIGGLMLDTLMLAVEPVDGHGRLVISVFFRKPSATMRATAEALYLSRRPLATGYFRLWQLERVRARRVDALQSACDATDLGVLLLARSGDLLFANAAASSLLDAGDGLRRQRGSIQASEIADGVKLQVALNHVTTANDTAAGGPPGSRRAPLMRLRRARGKPLIVAIVPAEQRAVEPNDVAAFLYVFDPTLDAERLLKPVCRIFNLSPVETRLACMLADGHSLIEAAEALRIKEQTARSYLKQVFIKTDTKRQTELVLLMLSNIVRLGRAIRPELV